MSDPHEQNRRAWNEAMALQRRDLDRVAPFFRAGGSPLDPAERDDLGDLRGRRVLHLQCNDGHDSLSLVLLGAHVTGVDISDRAIADAREIAERAGLAAEFLRQNVLDFRLQGREPYDVVYASRGVLCWISDLAAWMAVAAAALRPGGFLYLLDDHPMGCALDEELRAHWSYFHAADPEMSVGLSYLGQEGVATERNFQWQWSLGDVVACAVGAGLRIVCLREHPYAFYRRWPMLIEREGRYVVPKGVPPIPLTFAVRADRP